MAAVWVVTTIYMLARSVGGAARGGDAEARLRRAFLKKWAGPNAGPFELGRDVELSRAAAVS